MHGSRCCTVMRQKRSRDCLTVHDVFKITCSHRSHNYLLPFTTMSQVYASEPATGGRVVFETTHGPIEIQLWSRECPLTTRCFLQLCLDGFYNDCLWHRIVPNFLIQTGAIRNTELQDDEATKKQKIKLTATYRQAVNAQTALERRQYELHSRLMFRRRGLVAMALGVQEDEDDLDATGRSERGWMQPQFFITLDEAPYLNGKHVIFGSVSGPTIFNVVRIATKTHVNEETSQPVEMEHAPRIQSVKIMENPFPDMQEITMKRTIELPWALTKGDSSQATSKKRKRKGIKNVNVLSFGSELEEEPTIPLGKMKSRHEVEGKPSHPSERDNTEVLRSKATSNDLDNKQRPNADGEVHCSQSQNDLVEDEKVRNHKGSVSFDNDSKSAIDDNNVGTTGHEREPSHAEDSGHEPSDLKSSTQQAHSLGKEKKCLDDIDLNPQSSNPPSSAASKLSTVEARRLKYANRKVANDKKQREEDTMGKLLAFKAKVLKQVSSIEVPASSNNANNQNVDNSLAARMARRAQAEQNEQPARNVEPAVPTYRGQILDVSDDERDQKSDWLKTKFKCRKHMDLDSRGVGEDEIGGDGRNMDDYEVVYVKGDGKGDDHRRRRKSRDNDRHHGDQRKQDNDRRR